MKQFRDTNYSVSEAGIIINTKTGKVVKIYSRIFSKSKYHREYISLSIGDTRKMFFLHRVLAEVFIPNPENKEQVNHKDGNPMNNKLDNLEWSTCKENNRHAVNSGLRNVKLNKEKAEEIRALLQQSVNYKDIMKQFGVDRSIIYRIKLNQSWT